MNYLAHIVLSGADPDIQVGGLLGDFVKGPLTSDFPDKITQGIRLHRRIDSRTDSHPEFRSSLALLPAPWRRYGGILLDVYFDYLLASDWANFGDGALDDYCQNFYAHLHQRRQWLPERALSFCNRAPEVRWLESYARREMIPLMLNNIGRRLRRPLPLGEAWPALDANRPVLEQVFHPLMASHRALATDFLQDSL